MGQRECSLHKMFGFHVLWGHFWGTFAIKLKLQISYPIPTKVFIVADLNKICPVGTTIVIIHSSSYLPIEWNPKYRHLSLLKVRRTITDMPPMPALTLPNAVQNFIVEMWCYSVIWAKVTSIHYTIKVAGNEAGCVCIVNYLPKLYS